MSSKWRGPIAPDGKPPMITITFTEPIVFEKLIIVKGEGDKASFQVCSLGTWLIRVRRTRTVSDTPMMKIIIWTQTRNMTSRTLLYSSFTFHEQFESSYKYKDVCLFLDDTETLCTEEYDGRPLVVNAWDDRIVWTAQRNQINRITKIQVFG